MKNLALIMTGALALSACSKDDSKNPGAPAKPMTVEQCKALEQNIWNGIDSSGMAGVWAYDFSSTSKYKNHLETVSTSYHYWVIASNLTVKTYSYGHDKKSPQEKISNFGTIRMEGGGKGTIEYSQELIDQARRDGVPEKEIQDALAKPCKVAIVNENELSMDCGSSKPEEKLPSLKRQDPTSASAERVSVKCGSAAVNTKLESLSLGGKTFRLISEDYVSATEGKEPTKWTQKGDDLPEEWGTGDKKHPNLKVIKFSADMKTLNVNGKYDFPVTFKMLKSLNGLAIEVLRKDTETSSTYMLDGAVEIIENGFTVKRDSSYETTRTTSVKKYELVP